MKMLSNRTGGWIPALIFAVLMITTTGLTVSKVNAQDYYDDNYSDYGDYQEFYDDLSPYGQWLNDPQYGYVWAPGVDAGFRPYYTNGHWVMTEYGNMWVSDYPWGWAPFHYGRWAQSGIYGWIWIPGRQWGPAWVNWRQGGGYYGWAPMGPGISINISFGSGYNIPTPWWTFIPCGNIYSGNYSRYYSPRRTVNIINNTTIINNTYVDNRSRSTYISGPRRSEVEAYTRQRVPVYNVSNRTRAGAVQVSGRQVNVYRPTIRAVSSSREMPAPRQVKNVERSVITNAGGGRPPARVATPAARQQMQNGQQRAQRDPQAQQRVQRDPQMQQQRAQQQVQRDQQQQQRIQRDQQMQQQRAQQQVQRDQQQQQRIQRDQQMQQQRVQQQAQRDQQMQMQREQQQQQRIQRDQQMQMQRAQQQQAQRDQQMQMQRAQQQQQMQQQRAQQQQMQMQRTQQQQQMQQQRAQQQQMQRSQQQQQQRSVERAQPQRVERAAPRGR